MTDWLKDVLSGGEPLPDAIYGPRYRCSLYLKDGTHLPCAVIQPKRNLIDLAKRRIRQETTGHGVLGGADAYDQILATFVAHGNRVNDYDVESAEPSKFAIPGELLDQIEGETTMGWTGWVFQMRDGTPFSYGSAFSMEFFDLPDGYSFADVETVINHSYVDSGGSILPLNQGPVLWDDYRSLPVLRERVFFTCFVDEL
jgi:hypothetical protein